MLLYYITDRTQFAGDEKSRRQALLNKISEAAVCGIDFIQLREKDLSTRELESLSNAAIQVIRGKSSNARVLINSRSDVALACGADGVHLRSDDISPSEVRKTWSCSTVALTREKQSAVIAISCHTTADVTHAAAQGADFAVFAPVFEKKDAFGVLPAGLSALSEACCAKIPVLALGGITVENARACIDVGAQGIAGIRLFQEHDIASVIRNLRS